MDPNHLPQIITAIGGLGTAAFGLLEVLKPVCPWINRMGFGGIRATVTGLTPEAAGTGQSLNVLPQEKVLQTLLANWINGTDLASQKSIAKSLIKLHLNSGNASAMAGRTNVDAEVLAGVAASAASGTSLTQAQNDAYARFDLIVTAQLDECYQHADQVYRNWTRTLAAILAVGLALAGAWSLAGAAGPFGWHEIVQAVLIGLLATPLAPIAKDISSALATAVNTLQAVKK
jgi:hypothetical protein